MLKQEEDTIKKEHCKSATVLGEWNGHVRNEQLIRKWDNMQIFIQFIQQVFNNDP